jgi:uncharacterized protein with FMN-binding domain
MYSVYVDAIKLIHNPPQMTTSRRGRRRMSDDPINATVANIYLATEDPLSVEAFFQAVHKMLESKN